MERNLRRALAHGASTVGGYLAARFVSKWVEQTLTQIDDAFADLDFDDVDDVDETEPCICGSTEHESARAVFVTTGASLDNGVHGQLPVTATFAYYESDPLAVSMTLTLHVEVNGRVVGHDQQTWSYARDILDTAFSTAGVSGQGDVTATVEPHGDILAIWLTDAQGGTHRLELAAEPVRTFMINTYGIVPNAAESAKVETEVDTAIEALLDGTWEA